MAVIKDKFDNLCTYCADNYGECQQSPVFGNGTGNDNVIECDGFFDPYAIVELETSADNGEING